MLNDFNRIRHLIIGAIVGAFLALALTIPRADAQAGRAPQFEIHPVREDDKLFLIILDHGSNTVYRRVVTPDELRKGKNLETLIREQWAS